MKTSQRGGTILGLIFGMIIGLGAALAVAVYVTQVPVPFLSKGGKAGGQDAAEAERNKNWDPNAPLQGRVPAPPPARPPAVTPDVPPAVAGGQTDTGSRPVTDTASGSTSGVSGSKPETRADARTDAKSDSKTEAKGDNRTSKSSEDPLGDLVKSRSAAAEKAEKVAQADAAFNYFVQAGAFRGQSEADAQRAKLAMLGWEARVSEREQNGMTIFRVRVGPFTKRDDAESLKEKLDGAGVDSTLVRSAR